jgi:NAD(P)-dependent dehydrogenase (short-subunit alcohol dehydrogenase family)
MRTQGSVVFITGANRGLGLAFAHEALKRGAKKVYTGVRNPTDTDTPGIVQVTLDVTDPASIAAAATQCGDTTLLVNNAGLGRLTSSTLDSAMIDVAREVFETNFYGTILVSQAFAPKCVVRRDLVRASDAGSVFRLEICGMEFYQCLAH